MSRAAKQRRNGRKPMNVSCVFNQLKNNLVFPPPGGISMNDLITPFCDGTLC